MYYSYIYSTRDIFYIFSVKSGCLEVFLKIILLCAITMQSPNCKDTWGAPLLILAQGWGEVNVLMLGIFMDCTHSSGVLLCSKYIWLGRNCSGINTCDFGLILSQMVQLCPLCVRHYVPYFSVGIIISYYFNCLIIFCVIISPLQTCHYLFQMCKLVLNINCHSK